MSLEECTHYGLPISRVDNLFSADTTKLEVLFIKLDHGIRSWENGLTLRIKSGEIAAYNGRFDVNKDLWTYIEHYYIDVLKGTDKWAKFFGERQLPLEVVWIIDYPLTSYDQELTDLENMDEIWEAILKSDRMQMFEKFIRGVVEMLMGGIFDVMPKPDFVWNGYVASLKYKISK